MGRRDRVYKGSFGRWIKLLSLWKIKREQSGVNTCNAKRGLNQGGTLDNSSSKMFKIRCPLKSGDLHISYRNMFCKMYIAYNIMEMILLHIRVFMEVKNQKFGLRSSPHFLPSRLSPLSIKKSVLPACAWVWTSTGLWVASQALHLCRKLTASPPSHPPIVNSPPLPTSSSVLGFCTGLESVVAIAARS